MFFCDPCAKENRWPTSIMTSYGRCEMCHEVAKCNDVPSRLLPSRTEDQKK